MTTTEVMIRDIVDSKRMDGNIYEDPISKAVGLKEESILHGSIISNLFWPNLKNEEFNVPDLISKYDILFHHHHHLFHTHLRL